MSTTEVKPEPFKMPVAQDEHRWLQRMIGEWTAESEASPNGECEASTWTEIVRGVGDVWIVAEGTGEMPEIGTFVNITQLGYDPVKKKFVGSFIGSMMTNLWVYEGDLDANGRTVILDTEGPRMTGDGSTAKYRDSHELVDDDTRIMRSEMLGSDGNWSTFVTVNYRRVK